MLVLHMCTDPDKRLRLKRDVADIVENKIRAQLDDRESIFASYAIVMARQNVVLDNNINKEKFNKFLDKTLNNKTEYHYVCFDSFIYCYLHSLSKVKCKKLENLKIIKDGIEYTVEDDEFKNGSLWKNCFHPLSGR